ncbi:MAG: T9SS type A sorting domain-containing protein, partial [Bacteroidales bacterium]|nr:T9SS type A sorting domain-containing protein [Bacteroidales bacterium]
NADIIAYSDAAITEANLVYRYNGGEWNTIAMTHVAGNQYVANIPGDFARQYEYYITATDALGNTGSQPMMGALDPHTFTVPACLGVSAEFEAEMLQQIKGEPIQFHDKSQSDGPIYAWAWTFIAPDGSTITSTEQNPFVAFDQIGTYDVTLTATGATGSGTLTKEDYITITDGQLSFNMGDASQMTGNHIRFYDSGGPGDCYRNNENYTVTFYPIMPGGMMQVTFDRFDVENRYDYLFVYDGTSIAAPLIGKYCGLSLPPTIIASNEQGALTFRFYSDNSVTSIGWSANVDCIVYDYYDIHVCDNMQGGTITADCTKQRAGQTVTLTATPYGQSQLFSVSVTDEYGYEIRVEDMQFTMPESEVTICAVFDVFDVILMDNGSQQTPRALFYDHGGPNSNYANNENYVLTLYPQDNNHVLQVEFTDFYVENNWDKLYIYDGEAVQGTPVKTLTGKLRAETIGVIRATNPAGALTFQFQSDYSTTKFGWEAEITSVEDTPRYIYYIDNNTGDQNYLEGPAIAHGQSTVTLTVHTDATHVLEDAKLINLGEYDLDYYMSHPSGFTYSYLPVGDNTITFTMPDYNVAVEPLFREGHYENEYTLVTNIADLSAGGKYIIANTNVDGAAFAMSEQKNVNTADAHRAAVPVTVEDNKIIVSAAAEDKVKEFGFEGSSTRMTVIDPTFSDQFGDRGYLYVFRGVNSEGTSFVYALSTTTYSSYRYWRVNVGSNGAATLCGTSWAYYMHYNDATERFDVSNASSNVYIYKWSGLRFVEGSKEVCDAVNEMETAANIYPNPTQDNVVIEAEGMNHVSVYTLTGQRVYDEDVNASQMSLNMAQFGNGMYIVRIITNNGTAVKRVVVE